MRKKTLRKQLSEIYRLSTSPLRRSPNFLILGVVKGGTTSFYKYLVQHPMIHEITQKEVYYFKRTIDPKYRWLRYHSHFPFSQKLTGSQTIVGEASPHYFHNLDAPQILSKLFPQLKLIVLLRNPVDRAYSHYSMQVRNRKKKLLLSL